MSRILLSAVFRTVLLGGALTAGYAYAQGAPPASATPGVNWTAVTMFLIFVLGTLGITYRAAM